MKKVMCMSPLAAAFQKRIPPEVVKVGLAASASKSTTHVKSSY